MFVKRADAIQHRIIRLDEILFKVKAEEGVTALVMAYTLLNQTNLLGVGKSLPFIDRDGLQI